MKALILAFTFFLVTLRAFAGSPSNEEILVARAESDEAQLVFVQKIIARLQADEKVLADYWASYVSGLKPAKK